ncbi:IS110 family transposase [Mycobacterium vicinigordonae]|uniref:IS110 family transposase n=1 Tax=Mycobacterium vicinigordonae TaxID=1719132 RepID=A0A7D6I3T7_9MYCO|nr:IS110 family transposase [Mycobacterium vicinigordonae]QLL06258.1 IS110 family transposase [Mycobacterium vicinigordonae]
MAVGIDIAKAIHWVCLKIRETGQLLASHKVDNTPADIAGLVVEIRAAAEQYGAVRVGIDIVGGIAALAEAMLLDAGITLVHVPGLAVNRARRATVGGEHKSDPKDAAVIAGQVRMREDLRPVTAQRDVDVDLRLLVGRRSEIVTDQASRAARLRDLLVSIHPGLERVVDVTGKAGLHLLTRYVTPAEIRATGRGRLLAMLRRAGHVRETTMTALTDAAVAAAQAQRITVPGEAVAADLIRALATEILSAHEQLKTIDARIEAILAAHPDAALVRSLPGMGAALTAEFLAITGGIDRYTSGDQLAAAAVLTPVLKQAGISRYLQRASAGDRALKRVFYQSAFIAISCDPASKTYYQRKRTEGKVHHQAVISLARRRVNVLHAILRNRQPYNAGHAASAA